MLIRNLTSPQIVIITCWYLRDFNLNLSWATRNVLTKRIICLTKIRSEANSLFFSFYSAVNSCFLDFLLGVLRSKETRTYPDLYKAITEAFEAVSLNDLFSWFQHCGYCIPPN